MLYAWIGLSPRIGANGCRPTRCRVDQCDIVARLRAKEAIALIAKELPDMLVGAGTVLTTQQADDAIEAGAKFIVSPGLNPNVVRHCIQKGIAIVPGCGGGKHQFGMGSCFTHGF